MTRSGVQAEKEESIPVDTEIKTHGAREKIGKDEDVTLRMRRGYLGIETRTATLNLTKMSGRS